MYNYITEMNFISETIFKKMKISFTTGVLVLSLENSNQFLDNASFTHYILFDVNINSNHIQRTSKTETVKSLEILMIDASLQSNS
jgi:acyl-CoA thioesterase